MTGDKFKPELHLKQPEFTYIACGPFTEHCERIQKFRETGNLKHLNRIELDKTCFAHDEAYSDSKELAKRTILDKILNDRAYEIGRNHVYQCCTQSFFGHTSTCTRTWTLMKVLKSALPDR